LPGKETGPKKKELEEGRTPTEEKGAGVGKKKKRGETGPCPRIKKRDNGKSQTQKTGAPDHIQRAKKGEQKKLKKAGGREKKKKGTSAKRGWSTAQKRKEGLKTPHRQKGTQKKQKPLDYIGGGKLGGGKNRRGTRLKLGEGRGENPPVTPKNSAKVFGKEKGVTGKNRGQKLKVALGTSVGMEYKPGLRTKGGGVKKKQMDSFVTGE